MITTAERNVNRAGLSNVGFVCRDVFEQRTGLEPESADMVLLFNILHFPERRVLLEEACRILRPSGIAAIIHWRKDIETPRGPRNDTRPDRASILESITGLPFSIYGSEEILEPYHLGILLIKDK